ncbi:NAD(P)-binding protein [Lindgomyces ingoldianus]|uniref:NAD(P)-binding protein n=1 Tax=Lindgomyces ingoldianus TaxID=673940 RepID=A0ACB6RC59_9PLEO|nr:NAD(P)-binding protein [Lindgomyces ingoldianus]KAF2475912.1 NAD(P)-binding protein [Lindgomyces ingoldianus]
MPPALAYIEYSNTFHHQSYPAISPTRPELSATGKTVFISGGGRGLGTGIVDAFAQAGAKNIVIMGRNATALQSVATATETAWPSTKITTVAGDVSCEADVARAFDEVKKVAPAGIDVVVANAGYLATVAPIPAATPAAGDSSTEQTKLDPVLTDWWRAFEVNVKGVFLLARHFLALAVPNAVFLNVSAGACHLNPVLPGFSGYAGSKIATARVVETLQAENPAFRFYSVQPGAVMTDMLTNSGLLALPDLPLDDLELPGHFMVWLASPEAEFLKGKFLWANWDVEELKEKKEKILAGNNLVTGLVGWA